MPINVIIVDDEPAARQILEQYVSSMDQLHCCGSFHDPVRAFGFLLECKVDIVLLDINMPKLSGIELSKSLPPNTAIIFTTAYSEHALAGFELGAIDYLVKPISLDRFLKAIWKASKFLGMGLETSPEISSKSFSLKIDGVNTPLATEDISHLQSFGNYLKVYQKGKVLLAVETLKNAEHVLKAFGFLRIHRSYLVNTSYIQAFQGKLQLTNDTELPVGQLYRKDVLDFLANDD